MGTQVDVDVLVRPRKIHQYGLRHLKLRVSVVYSAVGEPRHAGVFVQLCGLLLIWALGGIVNGVTD
jgi:hypothetical protein